VVGRTEPDVKGWGEGASWHRPLSLGTRLRRQARRAAKAALPLRAWGLDRSARPKQRGRHAVKTAMRLAPKRSSSGAAEGEGPARSEWQIVVADIAGLALARSEPSILLVDRLFGTPRCEQTVGEGLEFGAALIQQLQAIARPDELAQCIKQLDDGESLVRCPISRNRKGDGQERTGRSRSLHGGSPYCWVTGEHHRTLPEASPLDWPWLAR